MSLGLNNVVAIAAGYYHSLALKADGTVTAWGDNTYDQINLPASLSNVVATNNFGAATNRAATLTVLRSAPRLPPPSLVFTNGGFGWQLDRLSGQGAIVIETSSNLVNWTPMLTNLPHAVSLPIIDVTAPNLPARFYRAVEQ